MTEIKKLNDAPAYLKIWPSVPGSQELPKVPENGPVHEIRGPRVESYAVWWWESSEEWPAVFEPENVETSEVSEEKSRIPS